MKQTAGHCEYITEERLNLLPLVKLGCGWCVYMCVSECVYQKKD